MWTRIRTTTYIITHSSKARHARQIKGGQTVPVAIIAVQFNQIPPVIPGNLVRASGELDGGNVFVAVGREGGKGGVDGRCHIVAATHATVVVAVKGHGQNVALRVKGDGGPADQYIDFRQLHAVRTGITGWKNRSKDIAALFGGVVPRAIRLPRHAGYGDRLRGWFGVVGRGVPGHAQCGGQGQAVQPRTRWDGLIFHRLV